MSVIDKMKYGFTIMLVGTTIGCISYVTAVSGSSNQNTSTVKAEQKSGEDYLTQSEPIPYEVIRKEDASLEYGKEKIESRGVNGTIKKTYKVIYENGIQKSKELIEEKKVSDPKNEVVLVGTKIVWHCVDVTSYDRNPYNDNQCANSIGEVLYVSDSQSIGLDPSYKPGKSGAWYYNNK